MMFQQSGCEVFDKSQKEEHSKNKIVKTILGAKSEKLSCRNTDCSLENPA